ncbi:signal peptide peptidase SppA [uncultured Psychromonas sp.]|uniref:signal peptide peptidase SppA n=1 Tax=uncultured Psychromonas sp. TaxID=173974 RepID=UPI002638AA63|nr:signal peptide peptidase SppA [uncultured Psychromonas sp.]
MAFLFNFIKQLFVKGFKFINFIRLFILNSLFLIIILVIFISFRTQEEPIKVADNSYLRLDLNGYIVEKKQPINISQEISKQLAGLDQEVPQAFETQELIKTIRSAKHDNRITGLVLELTDLQSASLDQLSDIGEAIKEFKADGKPVFAYADNYTQTQYYLAAYADHITLPPNGFVLLQGYSVNRLYFKDLLDTLLVTPHIFKVGTYKSFVEPFTETKMSQYSKEANQHWLDQLWESYIKRILAQRKDNKLITANSINPDLESLKAKLQAVSGDTSEYALSVGLVDELAFYDDFVSNLTRLANTEDDTVNVIDYNSYRSTLSPLYKTTGAENQIAVIHGTGEIVSGFTDGTTIADKSFNALLQQARNDSRVKAVVIRLDTPGGSAFASENIRQQVLALKTAGKKVVVSMGAVTASGGYWIASAADEIIASPTTLTGSIGIFGMFATIDKSLNKIGVHQDGVSTSPLSGFGITQPLSPELAEIFQIGIENGYANFLKVVSEGRSMSVEEVDKVAQGRVWTGVDGLENGLVDQLGDLQSAINTAASLANISDFDVISIEPKVSSKQAIFNQILTSSITLLPSGVIKQRSWISIFSDLEEQANFMTRLNDPQSRYVYCTQCYIE